MLSMSQGQDRALGVRHSPVITQQGLREVAGPRASQEAEPVGVGQGQGGTRSGADIGANGKDSA